MLSDIKKSDKKFTFLEFFAGGGMARAGLGAEWQCLFANDIDSVKASTYIKNWGDNHFDNRDIRDVNLSDFNNDAHLAWASFPCQDLSVAGNGLGIGDSSGGTLTRSGALWPFLDLIKNLRRTSSCPPILALENVIGLLTLEKGRDFAAICSSLSEMNYRYGAVIIDAKYFLAQSRPRVFIIAVPKEITIPDYICTHAPTKTWHSPTLVRTYLSLSEKSKLDWIWWDLGTAPELEDDALMKTVCLEDCEWNTSEETQRIISMMTPAHISRLEKWMFAEKISIGSLYLRMRREGDINKQRAEVTFSSILGCLRTPKGGASRSRIIVTGFGQVRTRLLSVKEATALMGLPRDYILPDSYQQAFKVIGDGVAVPSVRFLAERLLEPLVSSLR